MSGESEFLEFKAQYTDRIYREVIAFANTGGGVIRLGVSDDGDAKGLADIDDVYTRVTNGIRDAIAPDVTMFVKYRLPGDGTITIEVSEGAVKPYYLKAK